ncbi:MAG TPA: sugar transferase, partial [Candidatus Krumholzibacteria bacterium]|nr:sugar transferase [Candidatus Krumholzibacteria bacterium]
SYLPLLPVVLVIWGTLLLSSRQYRSHRTVPLLEEATDIVRITLLGAGILILTIFVFRLDELLLGNDKISRLWILLLASVSCCLLLSEKLAIRATARYVRARGFNYRSVLVVGTGPAGQEIAHALAAHRYWGFKVLGFIASDADEAATFSSPFPILGGLRDLPALVEEEPVDDVVFAVSRRDLDRMEDLFLLLQEQGIRTRFALNLFPHTQAKVDLEELTGVPLITFSTSPNSTTKLLVKRLLDLGLSSLLLLLGLPVVVIVALMIKITSGGQILFRQTRCGLHGRRFTLYKFRTMIEGAEDRQQELLHLNEMDGPVFKLRDDPRVTRLGRFLRKFSLDEIPQLWNVLRGDMSLVGPRPPIPEEVARYQRWQRRRLAMKPGLTCLWQISGRNHIDFERWMRLDLEYIDSWSPMLDMKILLKTIPVVLSGRGAS